MQVNCPGGKEEKKVSHSRAGHLWAHPLEEHLSCTGETPTGEVMFGNGGVMGVGWLMYQSNILSGRAAAEETVALEGEKVMDVL